MNSKITTFLLKKIRKKERLLKENVNGVYYITDGYIMFLIKEEDLEVNPDLIKTASGNILFNLANNIEVYEKAELKYFINKHNKFLAKIANEKHFYYLNYDLLKICDYSYFEIGSKERNVVRVFNENNEMIACICPIVHVKEN